MAKLMMIHSLTILKEVTLPLAKFAENFIRTTLFSQFSSDIEIQLRIDTIHLLSNEELSVERVRVESMFNFC